MNFALELFRKRQIPTIVYLFVSIIAYLLSFRQSVVSYTTERDQMSYKTYVVEGGLSWDFRFHQYFLAF